MATGPLPTFNVGNITLMAGLWDGYATALSQQSTTLGEAYKKCSGWEGQRADLFDGWWGKAQPDLARLRGVAATVSKALTEFAGRAATINTAIDTANALVLSHGCTDDGGGRWVYDVPKDATGPLAQWAGEAVMLDFQSLNVEATSAGLGIETASTWILTLREQCRAIGVSYVNASNACAETLQAATSGLKALTQVKEYSADSGMKNSFGVTSLGDPTWKQLTGGGIFRPAFPPGFRGNPLDGSDVPSWYKPSLVQKIENWVDGNLDTLTIIGSLALTLLGQPEAGIALSSGVSAAEAGEAFAEGDVGEGVADSVDVVLSVAKAPDAIAGAILGDAGSEATKDVTSSLVDYVRSQIQALGVAHGDDRTLTAAELSKVLSNAVDKAQQLQAAATTGS